ncbi:MAG: PKD domain-containing protein [Bacteroidota bacterium]|nr:PKD domain-containing protein [Bacteroidota bacterium]
MSLFAVRSLNAQIAANPTEGCAPLVGVQFTGLTGATNIQWAFGDGTFANINNPVHTFSSAGTYNVTYTATVSGSPVSQNIQIKAFGKPTPNFVYSSPANGCVPLSVTFTDQSSGGGGAAITAWQWSFGDGGISGVQNPTYSFSIGGQFDITLIVTDANGCDSAITKTDVATISPKPIVIINNTPNPLTSCSVPFTVNYDGSLSSSNSPIPGGQLTYSWDFGNGSGSVDSIPTATTYTATGNYTVTLICTDNNNCSQTAIKTVSIIQPQVDVVVPDSICKGTILSIRDTSKATQTIWDFGDGTGAQPAVTIPANVTHNYATAGTYTITATSSIGACNDIEIFVIVIDEVVAEFTTAAPHFTCDPVRPVSYINQTTGATSYSWSFSNGDTSSLQNPSTVFTQNSLNPYTIFEDLGLTATLYATSAFGCVDSVAHTLDTIHRPTAFFYTDGREGCSPLTITFTDSSFSVDPITQANNVISYEWIFGDGTPNVVGPTDTIVTHTYLNPGVDTAYLVIHNANGCTDTSFFYPITSVVPPDPDFTFSPSVVCPQDPVVITNNTDPADSVNHWHVISDATYFSGCINDPNPSWNFTHTGVHDITLVGYTHSCRNDTTVPLQVTVKGPISTGRFHTQCGDSAYKVMFEAYLQDADSATWDYGDGVTETVIGNGSHTTYHIYTASGDYNAILTGVNGTSGCIPYKDTLVVTVRKIQASFGNAPIVCDGVSSPYNAVTSVDVMAGCGVGYTWYFSNFPPVVTEDSILNHPLPQGVHTITLIVKDANECRDTVTGSVRVSKVDAAFALNDTIGCLPSFPVSTVQGSTSDTTITNYSWNFGDGSGTVTGATATHDYTVAAAPSQNYIVTLTTTNILGCVDNHTITVSVNAPSCTITTNSLAFICAGTSVTFSCTPSAGITPTNYAWNFGDGSPVQTTALPTVNHPFTPGGTYTVSVGVIDGAGCQGMSTNTSTVQVQDYPQAAFQFINQCDSTKAVACAGCGIAFVDTSINSAPGPRQWNLGTGGPIVGSQTVGTTYTAVGDYPISLIVSTTFGCRDTVLDTIHVLGASADFSMDKNAICKGDAIQFTVTSQVNVATWHWDFGDGTEDVAVSPVSHNYNYHPPGGTTNATLIYWTQDSACRYSVVKPISIYQVIADFDRNNETLQIDSIHCLGTQDLFTNTSQNATTYSWSFGDGNTSTVLNPTYTYAAAGTYTVSLFIADTQFGCKDTLHKPMEIIAPPNATAMGGDTCAGKPTFLYTVGNPDYTYVWHPGTLIQGSDSTNANPQTINLTQTTTFTVEVTNGGGCKDTITTTVNIQQEPAQIDWDTTVIIGQQIPIPGYAGSGMIYSWNPTDYLSCSNCPSPVSSSLADIVYIANVSDPDGCFNKINTFTIKVEPKATVDVPTAFTPDGDGTNDVIYVDGWGIKKLIYFRIYNRWGQLLFESTDLETGWDGYYNGVLQNMETYVYQASAETYTDIAPVEIKGSFKLIR